MKKLILIICMLFLVGCQTDESKTKDYGKLIETSVSKRYQFEKGKEVLIETTEETFDAHNNVIEHVVYDQEGSLLYTLYMGYDTQDRKTTERIIDHESDREVKYQYAKDHLLNIKSYNNGMLLMTADYVYFGEDVVITLTDADGNVTSTVDEVKTDNVLVSSRTDYKWDKVIVTTTTYDENDLPILIEVSDGESEFTEIVYDDRGNQIKTEHYKFKSKEKDIRSKVENKYVYDDHGNTLTINTSTSGDFPFEFRVDTIINYQK